MDSKKTLVIGASNNPQRYSHKAVLMLQDAGLPHIALGLKPGKINGTEIETRQEIFPDIDTVSLYLSPRHQDLEVENYLLALKPRRVIFNPGAENHSLMGMLRQNGIEVEAACTLVLLRIGQY